MIALFFVLIYVLSALIFVIVYARMIEIYLMVSLAPIPFAKLKLFRSEAIRVGFARLWKEKNYQAIVNMAQRLPEQTIQEDQNLLMYYDISLSRI